MQAIEPIKWPVETVAFVCAPTDEVSAVNAAVLPFALSAMAVASELNPIVPEKFVDWQVNGKEIEEPLAFTVVGYVMSNQAIPESPVLQ